MTKDLHPLLVNATNSELVYDGLSLQRIEPVNFVIKTNPKYNHNGVVVVEEVVDVVENIYDVSNFKHLIVVEPRVLEYANRNHLTGYVSYASKAKLPDGTTVIDYLYS